MRFFKPKNSVGPHKPTLLKSLFSLFQPRPTEPPSTLNDGLEAVIENLWKRQVDEIIARRPYDADEEVFLELSPPPRNDIIDYHHARFKNGSQLTSIFEEDGRAEKSMVPALFYHQEDSHSLREGCSAHFERRVDLGVSYYDHGVGGVVDEFMNGGGGRFDSSSLRSSRSFTSLDLQIERDWVRKDWKEWYSSQNTEDKAFHMIQTFLVDFDQWDNIDFFEVPSSSIFQSQYSKLADRIVAGTRCVFSPFLSPGKQRRGVGERRLNIRKARQQLNGLIDTIMYQKVFGRHNALFEKKQRKFTLFKVGKVKYIGRRKDRNEARLARDRAIKLTAMLVGVLVELAMQKYVFLDAFIVFDLETILNKIAPLFRKKFQQKINLIILSLNDLNKY